MPKKGRGHKKGSEVKERSDEPGGTWHPHLGSCVHRQMRTLGKNRSPPGSLSWYCCPLHRIHYFFLTSRTSYDLLYLSLNIGSWYIPKTSKTMEKQDVTKRGSLQERKESGKTVKVRSCNLCGSTLDIGM